MFFVCITSNYITDVPVENLKAESIVSSIYYLINYIKIRFGKKLELLLSSSPSRSRYS